MTCFVQDAAAVRSNAYVSQVYVTRPKVGHAALEVTSELTSRKIN